MSDDRIKHRLESQTSQKVSNKDGFMKLGMFNNERTLPIGEINKIVDVGEQFNKERQSGTYYRFITTIRPLMTNVLMNLVDVDSWSTFDTVAFKDQTYPKPTPLSSGSLNQLEDITYVESVKKHLKEIDGWFGYYNPATYDLGVCQYIDMEPKRRRFSFKKDRLNPDVSNDGLPIKNWEMTITYPSEKVDTPLTLGGLLIFEVVSVLVGQRIMTAVGIPVKHNLGNGQIVRITGAGSMDGDYTVQRRGLDNGDYKDYYFCIDVDPIAFSAVLGGNSRMKKVIGGEESTYYWRKFTKVKTRVTSVIENDDYEVYPLTFANNIYNDGICQAVFNEDIDISDLRDNLGRPISELFITVVKTQGNQLDGPFAGFTPIQSGIEVPIIDSIQTSSSEVFKADIPDIRRMHDDTATNQPIDKHNALEDDINITAPSFYGDVVEYNRFKVKETILADVHHRFNTQDRIGVGSALVGGPRQEGYYYKAHYPMRIRNFSNYIEQGDVSTGGIPDYAEDLGDGRWLWRDLLDIGFDDGQEDPVNYPFLNGSHYLHKNLCITLKRQDPFGKIGLFYSASINGDPSGDPASDVFITKSADDVC